LNTGFEGLAQWQQLLEHHSAYRSRQPSTIGATFSVEIGKDVIADDRVARDLLAIRDRYEQAE
jgi:hypothetical protein